MLLAGPCDQEFLGLLIAEETHHGIFFHELVQPVGKLVFIITGLRLDGKSDGRFRQRDPGKADGIGFVSHGVTGKRVTQLGHRANVARMQLCHRNKVLALRNGEVGQLL